MNLRISICLATCFAFLFGMQVVAAAFQVKPSKKAGGGEQKPTPTTSGTAKNDPKTTPSLRDKESDKSSSATVAKSTADKSKSSPKPERESKGGSTAPGNGNKTPSARSQSKTDAEDPDDDEELEDDLEDEDDVPAVPPKEGTAEWFVFETSKLRLEESGDELTPTEAEKLVKKRQQKIVELATKAVALTHKDREKSRVFDLASRHLLEARLQLAMTEADLTDENTQALYEAARALYKRDPGSTTAAVGALSLVQLAYHHAIEPRTASDEWTREFAVQSRHYLKSFPTELSKSVPLAYTSARLCEKQEQADEAIKTFQLIVRVAGETTHGMESEAIVRRLELVGNSPQIAGKTMAGAELNLDDLLGSPVLVVFWSSTSKDFVDQLPSIKSEIEKAAKLGLKVVGIPIESDVADARSFSKEQKLAWEQLVFEEPEFAGWNNPITQYYGIYEVPQLWLIDRNGNVVSTTATAKSLGKELRNVLVGREKVQQTSGEKGK